MMRLLRVSLVGGSAPKPPGFFRFFSARMGAFVLWSWGAAVVLPPRPVPAAAPVARVASQQSPIPSDGGRLIINPSARALNEKAANGDSPLNFVSHAWGSPQYTPGGGWGVSFGFQDFEKWKWTGAGGLRVVRLYVRLDPAGQGDAFGTKGAAKGLTRKAF